MMHRPATVQALPDPMALGQNPAGEPLQAAPDTLTQEPWQISEDVSEVAQLLYDGQWDVVWVMLTEGLIENLVTFLPRLFAAFLIFILLYALFRVIDRLLNRALHRAHRVDAGLQSLLSKTYRAVALAFIAVIVLGQFGFDVTALIAGLSIVGIAFGFAARDSLENFISGITILIDKPFRVGDNIEIEEEFGTVEEITLRSTRLRNRENQILVMPNSLMINQKLINHTMMSVIRVEIPFGIAYKEYPEEAREVVLEATRDDDRLHPDYPPSVVVTGLNDSSVDMALRIYIRNPKLEFAVRFEYTEKVREALREASIEIPFPHLQLFIDEAKAFKHTSLMNPRPNNDPED